MNITLGHMDWSPVIYGLCLVLSVLSMAWKLKRGHYGGFLAEVGVVALILIVHGGSVTGGFAATIAGLLSGWFIPLLFNGNTGGKVAEYVEPNPHVISDWDIYQMTRKS